MLIKARNLLYALPVAKTAAFSPQNPSSIRAFGTKLGRGLKGMNKEPSLRTAKKTTLRAILFVPECSDANDDGFGENSSSQTVCFNVGGTVYEVSKSLLEEHPDSILTKLSSQYNDGTKAVIATGSSSSGGKALFIERDGERFRYVLDFMRNEGTVVLPPTVSKDSVLKDLTYCGFDNVDDSKITVEGFLPEKVADSVDDKPLPTKKGNATEKVAGSVDDNVLPTKKKNATGKAAESVGNERESVLSAVKKNGYELLFAPSDLRDDKEIVLAAVNKNGGALKGASKKLKNDKDVVMAAVKENPWDAFKHASDELKNDKDVVMAVVKGGPWDALKDASDELKANKEIVLAAVKLHGTQLRYASDELRADKEIVLAALKSDARAIAYASPKLRETLG